jgi:hypothetical protein
VTTVLVAAHVPQRGTDLCALMATPYSSEDAAAVRG